MRVFRIYTEDSDKNMAVVLNVLDHLFKSYTILRGIGSWCCNKEKCIVAEIITDAEDKSRILIAAENIRRVNQQITVLVTTQDVDVDIVGE